jgi:hypothetical protein
MGKKEDMYNASYAALCNYIESTGKMCWETHPICLRDKCIDGIAIIDGKLVPYNTEGHKRYNPFTDGELKAEDDITSLKSQRTITVKTLDALLEDMKNYDAKKKQ